MIGLGTILNVVAILIGSAVGVALGHRLPQRTRDVVTDGLGLITLLVAALSAASLVDASVEPFDLVFIDADKANLPTYLERTMALTRPGALVVIDNVVRDGRVLDEATDDPHVRGVQQAMAMIARDPRLEATALQTVGAKGWDGLAIARRVS